MFGFIKRKIREFTDSFKQEAEEEPIPESSGAAVDAGAQESDGGSRDTPQSVTESFDRTDTDAEAEFFERAPSEASEQVESDSSAQPIEPDRTDAQDKPRVLQAEQPRARVEQTLTAHDALEAHESDSAIEDREARRDRAAKAHATKDQTSIEPEESASVEPQTDGAPRSKNTPDQEAPARAPRGFGRLMGAITKRSLSDDQFERIFADLEIGLLEANTAYDAVQAVKENLRTQLTGERVSRFSAADDVARALKESITALFAEPEDLVELANEHEPLVIMLIGINGSGKTTTAAKLARAYQKAGKRPVLAAADTFRAAAIQQLEAHAKALDCRIIKHDYGADPTAVAFDALSHAKSGKADVVLIDTAGRLHSNENLLKELEKLKRIIKPHRIIFVGESIAGNDLLEQAQTFDEKIGIDGIILTKTDVDESGGGMLSVSHVTGKPIDYLGGGQGYDDLTFFSRDVVARLLGLD